MNPLRHPFNVFAIALAALSATLATAAPQFANVRAGQRAGADWVDILYDISEPDAPTLRVSVDVSADGGVTFLSGLRSFSGSGYGNGVVPGRDRLIAWDAGADWNNRFSNRMLVRLSAYSSSGSTNIIVPVADVPAGALLMGSAVGEGATNENPAHTVQISAFTIDRFEVTTALWTEVAAWARANGYAFDYLGPISTNAHPVSSVGWFDAVKWCNARSEHDGLEPFYYADTAQTTVYRSGAIALTEANVKLSANGYRLPTEAEWEKAARGGLVGNHFPWPSSGGIFADHLSGSDANFLDNGDPYDNGTTPVGYFDGHQTPAGLDMANGYGLYDMAGNAWEWCWDRFGEGYYAISPAVDPRGPAAGEYRVMRGGSWGTALPFMLRCAFRGFAEPGQAISGLRCVLALGSVPGTGFTSIRFGPFTLDTRDSLPLPPAAPTGVSASDGSYSDKIRVVWNPVVTATRYQIWRARSSNTARATQIAETVGTAYDDRAPSRGQVVFYWIKAVNSNGISAFSAPDRGWRRAATRSGRIMQNDFDGDGRSDLAVFSQSAGILSVLPSSVAYTFGPGPAPVSSSKLSMPLKGSSTSFVNCDFDGDGLADPSVYNSADGRWAAALSSHNYEQVSVKLGGPNATPQPADYDGDGRTDPAIYVPETGQWTALLSGQHYTPVSVIFGGPDFQAVPADYDGDGLADLGLYCAETGEWQIRLSGNSYAVTSRTLGGPGCIPASADFDGDGIADPAVFEAASGRWSALLSSRNGERVDAPGQIGGVGFIPVPGDYDGDGLSDPTVYREKDGLWLTALSGSGYATTAVVFGGPGSSP